MTCRTHSQAAELNTLVTGWIERNSEDDARSALVATQDTLRHIDGLHAACIDAFSATADVHVSAPFLLAS